MNGAGTQTVSTWLQWSELPWLSRAPDESELIQLLERLGDIAGSSNSRRDLLRQALPDVCAEVAAAWAALYRREPDWELAATYGRSRSAEPQLLSEVLDRDAGRFLAGRGESAGERAGQAADGPLIAVPVPAQSGSVLVLGGRALEAERLASVMAIAQVLGHGLALLERLESSHELSDRFRKLLQLSACICSEDEVQKLLEKIAKESTQLMDCDRASIFLWDKEARQIVACPALGMQGGRLFLPDNKGIVGEVLHTRETIIVDDAYADSRFNQKVDKDSGYRTRNLACAPLIDGSGECIGAYEAINKNAGDFEPIDRETLHELCAQVAAAVKTTQQREQLIRSNRQLTEQVAEGVQIIGESASIEALRATIGRLAATDLPVLILGESGTGKEVAAQALHFQGTRSERPFVAVNCAALTETLLESELFGHERGAFTDAHETRAGKFELADGGTLFLDEIGDMSPGGQAKLLRVLEQKVITRVGGSQPIPINVRVIAATNTNLAEAVREKRFREDLYYRLSVVTLDLPPLRDRPEDVIPLAEFFLTRFCEQARRKPLKISAEARRRLQAHAWPGNVRELRNLMERVAFLATGEQVEADDIAFIFSPQQDRFDLLSEDVGLSEATERFQQEYIGRAIKRVQGNMSEAAKLLGLHRSNLYRKMRQLGMESGAEG